MSGKAQIFLGDLDFEHQRRMGHRPEERMEWLTRLKVDRSVLHLHNDVAAEFPVQWHEFVPRLLGAVVRLLLRIHERAPHNDSAMRCNGVGNHVGAVRMRSRVVLGTGLSFGVRFHQEATEVRDERVDLIGLGAPPVTHARVERVSRLQATDFNGSAEYGGQIYMQSVRPEEIGQGRELAQIGCRQTDGAGIDVGRDRAVDSQ